MEWQNSQFYNQNDSEKVFEIYCTPNRIIKFFNDSKEVGRLDFSKEPITFNGNADEAARLFFDNVIKRYMMDKVI